MQRTNESLIVRGYMTWFDCAYPPICQFHSPEAVRPTPDRAVRVRCRARAVTNMKGEPCVPVTLAHSHRLISSWQYLCACEHHATGSTMDAMSDAIEGADVMLYGVSLAYKESANVSTIESHRCRAD